MVNVMRKKLGMVQIQRSSNKFTVVLEARKQYTRRKHHDTIDKPKTVLPCVLVRCFLVRLLRSSQEVVRCQAFLIAYAEILFSGENIAHYPSLPTYSPRRKKSLLFTNVLQNLQIC